MSEAEREERPWGNYCVIGKGDGYQVKRIVVNADSRLSYQRHTHRSEHWIIVSGTGVAVLEGIDQVVGPGDAVEVPVGALHRIGNTGDRPLTFVEVQLGDYLGEDDIERLDDDFGRK